MPDNGEAPVLENETPMDRMLRFGTALFAVPKDELTKRAERKKSPRKKRPSKPEPG